MAKENSYKFVEGQGGYSIFKDGRIFTTPGGEPVETKSPVLAKRLVKDLNSLGGDPSNPESIYAFHAAMIDFFSWVPREELENSVIMGLSCDFDWTIRCPSAEPGFMMNWLSLFGGREQIEKGGKWLKTLSLSELCSVCVIGKAIESVNIPFIVATRLKKSDLKSFSKRVVEYYPYLSLESLLKYLDNFLFYFNLDLEEQQL